MKNRSDNTKKKSFSKVTLKRLDRLHKKNQELFKEDKIIIKELRRIINEQQRKASWTIMKTSRKNKAKKVSIKKFLANMDRIHKETEELFKEDEKLLKLLRKEINAQQRRRAS